MRKVSGIHWFVLTLIWVGVALLPENALSEQMEEVLDRAGRVVEVLDVDGASLAVEIHAGPGDASSAQDSVSPLGVEMEEVTQEDPLSERVVEPDGTIAPSDTADSVPLLLGGRAAAFSSVLTVGAITIDSMTLRSRTGTYYPASTIRLLGSADTYWLSDGSTWRSGAGVYYSYGAYFDRVEVVGDTVRYFLRPQTDRLIYKQTDYDSGDHSSVGTLAASGDLVLEATIGSTTAILRGGAEIVENTPANYPEPRFNYYSTVVGSVVPFELTYTMTSGTWQSDTFDAQFSYRVQGGSVDFANPISTPLLVSIEIKGSGRAPSDSALQYYAIAHYDNGSTANVTGAATWSVAPESVATIDAGLLSTGAVPAEGAEIEIEAAHHENGIDVSVSKMVRVVPRGTIDIQPGAWPTYQGNRGHTGYVPMALEPEVFSLRWERVVGPGRVLQQVAAGDGRVFVSVTSRFADDTHFFALDARDGAELWSKGFGRVNSVNPPALAYDTVYVQTGKESSSGQSPYLHALDSATGQVVFESVTQAQWESYFAPTVHDGHVYINGGYYGGMYGFDAFSGRQEWFLGLPQYDDWTPAVDETYAYAYVGEYSPGLYVADRITGELAFWIPDDEFDWNGWSMNLAPVLGGRDDVIAIHDRRLISFDVAGRRIGWQRASAFSGQPAVRDGVIYAVDGGALAAVDQTTGADLWRWSAPTADPLVGQIVVTDTHLFVRTATTTYAIEILSRAAQWSYPRAGNLALGNETLYIAQADGMLTAIAMPEYIPAAIAGLEIEAPEEVIENSTTQLSALVSYDDGRVRDRTALARWTLEPAAAGSISEEGVLAIGELFEPEVALRVHAVYEEDGLTVSDTVDITAKISVSVQDLVRRNLEAARQLREAVRPTLEEARMREEAARSVLSGIQVGSLEGPPSPSGARRVLSLLRKAIFWGRIADISLDRSIDDLGDALNELGKPDPEEPPTRPWWFWWFQR